MMIRASDRETAYGEKDAGCRMQMIVRVSMRSQCEYQLHRSR